MRLIIEADDAVKEMIFEDKSESISCDSSECPDCSDDPPDESSSICFNLC
ncbi:hypothetical protein SAMN02910292_00578 [Lachnospiraceae bacterium XBB2008]|nr:hypothetical protein SAMN02910292_00578 [Lachnospiraceae bacterium XBB2008]